MPPRRRKRPKNKEETPRASEVDRISDLPDGVLQHLLSFMPAHDAVRTCVLARRWRHLWRSAPAIRFTNYNWVTSADRFNQFVDRVLQLRRDGAPLESCDFLLDQCKFRSDHILADNKQQVSCWIWHALRCQVRVLGFCLGLDEPISLPERPLLSKHLTRLKLDSVCANKSVLDFSGCPTLLDLQMEYCYIDSRTISSSSLKHLRMIFCEFDDNHRAQMSLPNLVSLELADTNSGSTPLLESMPSLVTAIVSLGSDCTDRCDKVKSGGCGDDLCEGCLCYYDSSDDCRHPVFLHGLSQATDLKLSADPDVIVFKMDLKWCPTFSKLKTLVLEEWFVTDNLRALIWFLQHSPILEKLYLQLPEEHTIPEVTAQRYGAIKQSVSSDHLQLVEIKCWEVNKMVLAILKILNASGIPLEKIQIQKPSCFGCFNFVCTGFSSK